jgi:hypothetical protein
MRAEMSARPFTHLHACLELTSFLTSSLFPPLDKRDHPQGYYSLRGKIEEMHQRKGGVERGREDRKKEEEREGSRVSIMKVVRRRPREGMRVVIDTLLC